jgi:hypothetical protein
MAKPNHSAAGGGRAASSKPPRVRAPKAGIAPAFVDSQLVGPGDVSEFEYQLDTESSRPTQAHPCREKASPAASAAPPVAGAGDVSEFDYEAGE